tara:strand:- start:12527 stop:13231 length:705 start_codon:yes stop_codon:yes gene_type:complete
VAKTSRTKSILKGLAWILGGLLLLVAAIILLFRFVDPPTSAFIIADRLQHPERAPRQQWVDIDAISPWMPLAVIASEDQRFLTHWGLDMNAIAAAVEDYQRGDSLRGASTISQQTAKNLFLWNGRQFVRKGLEAGLTLGLEALWSKRRIMEVYLNIAEFGNGIFGVEAASQAYFGVSARYLSPGQAARLTAVLPNPKVMNAAKPSGYVWERVDWITRQMYQLGGTRYVRSLTGR